jgi:hypothetical protein
VGPDNGSRRREGDRPRWEALASQTHRKFAAPLCFKRAFSSPGGFRGAAAPGGFRSTQASGDKALYLINNGQRPFLSDTAKLQMRVAHLKFNPLRFPAAAASG